MSRTDLDRAHQYIVQSRLIVIAAVILTAANIAILIYKLGLTW